MRRLAFLIAVIASGPFVLISSDQAAASVSVGINVNLFHDSLAPYGDWVQSARFGTVWTPRHVNHDWRPYTVGHWVYTDYDWTWASDEEWGWATDHYGRWTFDPDYGWIWVPGDEWAPAWVAWRSGGGYVGWAPLPPDVDVFRVGYELRIDPFAYSFVETRHFCEPHVYSHFVPVARNVTFVNVTQNVTNYIVVNNRVINRGIEVGRIERASGHAVPRVQVREVASPDRARGARIERGQVAVFRPHAEANPVDPRREAHAFASVRPQDVERRQAQERSHFDSAEQRERTELQKIHEREDKHPPIVGDDRSLGQARHQDRQRAERSPEVTDHRANTMPDLFPTPARQGRVESGDHRA
ncbi:MAG: DUF6600 domain-containing protein, partial [Vicinamibacteria bacterium]